MHIRRYTHEDYPKFLELTRAVYDEQVYKKVIERFQWQYQQNPNNTSEDPLIFVLEDGDKFVGTVGTFAQKVKIADAIYPAYWIGDFMVRPDFRLGYNAINLAKMLTKLPILVMGFPVESSIKIWLRLGGTPFSQLVRYSKKIQSSHPASLDIKTKKIHRFAGKVSDCVTHVRDYLKYALVQGIYIVEVHQFDERFDRLWERISTDYQALQVRDSVFLNWRFFKCPYITYRVLAAIKKNEVLGYIVLREKKYGDVLEGNIVDLFIDRSNHTAAAALMEAGLKILKNDGCDVVKMTISADDLFLNAMMRKFSFLDCEKIDRGLFYNNAGNDLNAVIKESGNWFFTRADSDMDYAD